jgi:hypothetical protein
MRSARDPSLPKALSQAPALAAFRPQPGGRIDARPTAPIRVGSRLNRSRRRACNNRSWAGKARLPP